MRFRRRLIAVVLVAVIVVTSLTIHTDTAYAATTDADITNAASGNADTTNAAGNNADAGKGGRQLYKYKFITGTSETKMELKENEPLTREQLAVLLTELNGKKAEALEQAKTPKFSDAFSISRWARPYVAYAAAHGWMTGVGNNLFDAKGRVTGKQLALVLLRAMGYRVEWKEIGEALHRLGIPAVDTPLTRGEAFDYIWSMITKPLGKNGDVLAVKLGKMTELQISSLGYPSADLEVDKRGAKYGYVDFTGNLAIPYQFHEAHPFMGQIALVKTRPTGHFGLIDAMGKLVHPYELVDAQDQGDGIIAIAKADGQVALIDYSGTIRIPFSARYTKLQYDWKDKLVHAVNAKGMHGLLRADGEEAIPFVYSSMSASFDASGLRVVGNQEGTKFGAINRNNEIVIPFEYELLQPFHAGKAIAKKNGKYGIIDKDNHVYLSFAFDEIYGSYADKYLVFRNGTSVGMIDKRARLMISPKRYNHLVYLENEDRVIAREGELYGILKSDGTELAPMVYHQILQETDEILLRKIDGSTTTIRVFLVEKDGKKGCLALDGTVVVPLLEQNWEREYYESDFTDAR